MISLTVNNYKSLRHFRFAPAGLSVIVGANGAGKTNLADCFDFLSEVYRHGLEVAVARKGGYENMAFRRMRRAKGAMSFDVHVELPKNAATRLVTRGPREPLRFRHAFSFGVRGYSIRADFEVEREFLSVERRIKGEWTVVASVTRDSKGNLDIRADRSGNQARSSSGNRLSFLDFTDLRFLADRKQRAASSELLITSVGRYTFSTMMFVAALASIRVYRISPQRSREFGVPLPRAELDGSGANLPSVVDLLRKSAPKEWATVIAAMKTIMPKLTDISVDYTTTRTLGLLFHEEGVGRPWNVWEVSDGTVQALALLTAIVDKRFSLLVLEEPENSVHPWIIRRLLETCQAVTSRKQIIITSHSPLVIDAAKPEAVFVVWKERGESRLAALQDLDPHFLTAWRTGSIPTFSYLDSGAVPEALPPVDESFSDDDGSEGA